MKMKMMMINTHHTLKRKPISLLETVRLYTCPILTSPEDSFRFGEREDNDGCPSPTNCNGFISSLKAAMNFHVHIQHSTSKLSCQLWTAGRNFSEWGNGVDG